jgi:tetrahydromethanopterin S-methyltransferase subunit G
MNSDWLKSIDRRLSNIETKVEEIRLEKAHQSGKVTGASIVVSAIVSIIITGLTLYAKL